MNTVHQERIVVVGAGIIGLSTAYYLLQQGIKQVTVLEQASVDHKQSSSHGLSRLLRFEYGFDRFYSEMVGLSLERWRNLERVTGRILYTQTGLLALGTLHDGFTKPSYDTLSSMGFHPDRLSRADCQRRFPQFDTQDMDMFSFNPNAGMLHASNCLHTLRDLIISMGGIILEHARVKTIHYDTRPRPVRMTLSSGSEIEAERVVVAIGNWVHTLFGDLHLPVQLTRQYLLYFANLPGNLFGKHALPAFLAHDLYGFPLHNSCAPDGPPWLKAASHVYGPPADPDEILAIDQHTIQQVREQLCSIIPALADAQLVHVDAHIYDVSQDEHFILDYLPDDPRIVIAAGMTGHAFKFGLLLGEVLADMVRHKTPPINTERFQLTRFAPLLRAHVNSVA